MTFASLVAVVGFVATPLAAQHPPRNWGMDSTLYDHLGLTSEQRDKVRAIRDQVMQENAPLREQVKQVLGGRSFRDLTPEEREQYRPKIEPIRKQMRKTGRRLTIRSTRSSPRNSASSSSTRCKRCVSTTNSRGKGSRASSTWRGPAAHRAVRLRA
jgi:hypothetical protein